MRTKLTRTGNRLALILVWTNGQAIVVSPVRCRRRTSKLEKIVAEAHSRYGGVFRRLAE